MKILTAPSQDGKGYSANSEDLPHVIYKLGKIEYKSYSLIEEICDGYCRFPNEAGSQDELDDICAKCPLNKLHDIIYKGEKK